MKIEFFEGNAFTATGHQPLGQEPLGNPALICSSSQPLREVEMAEIARLARSPMTTFVFPSSDGHNLRYYSPKGIEVDFCGHASLVATYFLRTFLGEFRQCRLDLNPDFLSGQASLTGLVFDNEGIGIKTRWYGSSPLPLCDDILKLINALDVDPPVVLRVYQTELNDIVIVLHNNIAVRHAQPYYQKIIALGQSVLPHRTLVLTARSDEQGFDYESRVFIPCIGVNEDVACGSANCSVAPIWQNLLGKNRLKMFYASPTEEDIRVGGVQCLDINNSSIVIRSNVRPAWYKTLEAKDATSLINSAVFHRLMGTVSKAQMVTGALGSFGGSRKCGGTSQQACA